MQGQLAREFFRKEKNMNNVMIRNELLKNNLKQWELAELLGIGEYTMCRRLRKELPIEEQKRIVELIKENRKVV